MKKKDLASLAMIGITAGLVAGGCQKSADHSKNGAANGTGSGNGNGGNHKGNAEQTTVDQKTFRASLSPEAQKKFDELDAQHKMMAIEMADQKCNGENKCAGMGGCATSEHACAGENGCKGQGGPPVKDPNKAVDVQYKNQMDKSDAKK